MDVIAQTGDVHPGLLDDPSEHAWRAMKADEIDAIGPYKLLDGARRASDNVEYATALILDIDQTSLDMVTDSWGEATPHPALDGLRHYVVASPSNGWRKDGGKLVRDPACYSWKIIYPLDGKLSPGGLSKLLRSMVLLTVGSGAAVDRQTHDAARPCYMFQGRAPNFVAKEFNPGGVCLGREGIKAVVDEARGLDPNYVDGTKSTDAGSKYNPSCHVIDRVRRRKGGHWMMLSADCPIWVEDNPTEPSTLGEFYEEVVDMLSEGDGPDRIRGTIFGGSVERCLINMAGGMLVITDGKLGHHYAFRPVDETGDPFEDRGVPREGVLDQKIAADELEEAFGDIITVDDKGFPFLYDMESRTWQADMKTQRIQRLTEKFSGRLTRYNEKKGEWYMPWSWGRNWGRDVVHTLTDRMAQRPMTPWDKGLAFEDGLLSFSGDFRPRVSHDYVRDTDVLPFAYTDGATCKRWLQFLDDVIGKPLGPLGKNAKHIVQLYLGACLAGEATRCNLMLVLTGKGANGKSVLLDVIHALFAPSAVGCVPPHEWGSPADLIRLYHTKINIVSDVSRTAWKQTGVLKRVISGEAVTLKHLYKDSFSTRLTAGHWFSMNELPSVWDSTVGWQRRVRVIPFNRHFVQGEQDTSLTEKLLEELPGIALWAMEGYSKARAAGFKITPLGSEVEEDWRESNKTSTDTFVDMWMRPGRRDYSAQGLYPYYQAHAKREGTKPITSRAFSMHIARAFDGDLEVKAVVNGKKVYRIKPLDMLAVDGTLDGVK